MRSNSLIRVRTAFFTQSDQVKSIVTDDDDDEIDVTDRLRHGGSTLSVVKRVASEYGDDDVSPYAVFSMPALPPTYSSARRMKTFVVNKAHQPLEMNNYATPDQADADAYDYIAPDSKSYLPKDRPG